MKRDDDVCRHFILMSNVEAGKMSYRILLMRNEMVMIEKKDNVRKRTRSSLNSIAIHFVFSILHLLGPEPAFGRLGLGGSLGGYSSHGYTSHASLRAYGTQL